MSNDHDRDADDLYYSEFEDQDELKELQKQLKDPDKYTFGRFVHKLLILFSILLRYSPSSSPPSPLRRRRGRRPTDPDREHAGPAQVEADVLLGRRRRWRRLGGALGSPVAAVAGDRRETRLGRGWGPASAAGGFGRHGRCTGRGRRGFRRRRRLHGRCFSCCGRLRRRCWSTPAAA